MPDKVNNNAASRAQWLLLNARHERDQVTVLEAWSSVLVEDQEEVADHFEVVKLINSLREEILSVKAEAEKHELPTNLYKHYIEKALKATQVDNLNSPWANYKNNITDDVLLFFSFSAFIIGKDEFSFDDDDIEEIRKLIEDLNNRISEGEIDPLLKHFISLQIETLRHSLNEYHIRGTRAFKNTYITGISQIIENEELIRDNSSTIEIATLKKLWEKIKSSTETAAKANNAIDTWAKLIEKGSDAIGYLS